MSRLFITPREIDFINDVAKEVIKDVVGQKIYYYPVNAFKSNIHDIYEEAPEKVFDNPIDLNCLVAYEPEAIKTGQFGTEEYYGIEAFVQDSDLLDKEIQLYEGDFFSYGSVFFEVTAVVIMDNIFGETEYSMGVKLTGREARKSQFIAKLIGPTSEHDSDPDAIEKTFIQQRGFDENAHGPTGDVRELQKRGVLTMPITGPAEVSPQGGNKGSSAFYDES